SLAILVDKAFGSPQLQLQYGYQIKLHYWPKLFWGFSRILILYFGYLRKLDCDLTSLKSLLIAVRNNESRGHNHAYRTTKHRGYAIGHQQNGNRRRFIPPFIEQSERFVERYRHIPPNREMVRAARGRHH